MGKFLKWISMIPAWIFTGIVLVGIIWFSLAPHPLGEEDIPLFPGADKIAHAIMYGILSLALLIDYRKSRFSGRISWKICLLMAGIATIFGIVMEILQRVMHVGRSFEIGDIIADLVGSFLIAGFYMLFHIRSLKKKDVKEGEEVSENKDPEENAEKPEKKHHGLWWKIPARILAGIICFVLLIPVLIYIPPVQDFLKDLACDIVYKSTGMKVEIERFRLKVPIDVELDKVLVRDVAGDTMVSAKKVIADIKLLPLFKLDVKINKVQLEEGYYRMVQPDSSMIMAIRAGELTIDNKSSVDIRKSDILLNDVFLKKGNVSLYMDVWKKTPTPEDTTSAPFVIKANNLKLEDFTFAMSMLPTIDTLDFTTKELTLRNGLIDLGKNEVSLGYVSTNTGDITFLMPPAEYVKAHPAPVDSTSAPSAPMVIRGDSIYINDFNALYGIKGHKPLPGFDPEYMQFSGINIDLQGFYNKEASIILPIKSMQAKERCGLTVENVQGTVSVDAIGIDIADLYVDTKYSTIYADANVPFELMELKPDAKMNLKAEASIGKQDVEFFMPDLKKYLNLLPSSRPISLDVSANGSLSSLDIPVVKLDVPGVANLLASGFVSNPLDIEKLNGSLKFKGALTGPTVVEKLMGDNSFNLPELSFKGEASAIGRSYKADFDLLSTAGDIMGGGAVNLNSEKYSADIEIDGLDVARFMPDLGISNVSLKLTADGSGFNPMKGNPYSNINLEIPNIVYNGVSLNNIRAHVNLQDGIYSLDLFSPNRCADLDLSANGSISGEEYTIDLLARINHLDLTELGITKDINSGNVNLALSGTLSPEKWLYDLKMNVSNLDWNFNESVIHLPQAMEADFLATPDVTKLDARSKGATIAFTGREGLKELIDKFSLVGEEVSMNIERKHLDVEKISSLLPTFDLAVNVEGKGLLEQFLAPQGMSIENLHLDLAKDSIIYGNVELLNFSNESMAIDTVTLGIKERNSLIDYKVHMGNRAGSPLEEFANVNLSGYLGENRASLYLTQQNLQGETGYKIGLTAAVLDSVATIHFSPLNSTIAYLPWKLNADNYIDYTYATHVIDANLTAQSNESSIMLKSGLDEKGIQELHVKIDNLKIQDFLKMSVYAPPITASINTDLRVKMRDKDIFGDGCIIVNDFTYDKIRVGDFDMDFKAGMGSKGSSGGIATLKINGQDALIFRGILRNDSTGVYPEKMSLTLNKFPLNIANAFLGKDVASLSGSLNGTMALNGTFVSPKLNGYISCDSVGVYIPMIGSTIRFDNDSLKVDDNVLSLENFRIWGANKNPITINGRVDASSFTNIGIDMALNGNNVQLINTDNRSKGDIYGKLFVNLNATAKGPLTHFNVNANLSILNTTNIVYRLNTDANTAIKETSDGEVVKFVQFSDTTQIEKEDSIKSQVNMNLTAGLTIQSGTQVAVAISGTGTGRVELQPSGTLSFARNFMGDMKLNGQLNLGTGFASYALPVVGEKKFEIDRNSYVLWNGTLLNPVLNISATDEMKVSVQQAGGNTQLVNFGVNLSVTNTLSAPKIMFDLTAKDDLTVQNELQSMTPDQRSTQAMNLLLYGQYTGPGSKSSSASNLANNALYGFLTSQINSWAANNIRGVDLSFGVDQYDKSVNGQNSTTTSYSYKVSKSLFDNRFKIVVGGNYSTDASADENFAQNLLSDISFEYMLKQSNTQSMYVKLFRHSGFESIVEGEITETGVGFVMRRRMSDFRQFFRWRWGKRKPRSHENRTDSVKLEQHTLNNDTIKQEK